MVGAGGRPLENLAVVAGSGHHPGRPSHVRAKCLRDREVRAGQLHDLALHRSDFGAEGRKVAVNVLATPVVSLWTVPQFR
jgi:hypothetical protein